MTSIQSLKLNQQTNAKRARKATSDSAEEASYLREVEGESREVRRAPSQEQAVESCLESAAASLGPSSRDASAEAWGVREDDEASDQR